MPAPERGSSVWSNDGSRLKLVRRWRHGYASTSAGPIVAQCVMTGTARRRRARLVRAYRDRGADGIKVSYGSGHYPEVLAAITDEVDELGMDGVMVDLKGSETDARVGCPRRG